MTDRRIEIWPELKEKKERLDQHFLAGRIGESTYLVSLEILGYRPREARDELDYVRGLSK